MSIDVMIETMEQGLDPNGETIKSIIAALKAGQAMRYDADLGCSFMREACMAWDAATKEDV